MGPLRANDECAEFNAREAEAASRPRGPDECPHCPCFCHEGKVSCAPCEMCDPAARRVPPPSPRSGAD